MADSYTPNQLKALESAVRYGRVVGGPGSSAGLGKGGWSSPTGTTRALIKRGLLDTNGTLTEKGQAEVASLGIGKTTEAPVAMAKPSMNVTNLSVLGDLTDAQRRALNNPGGKIHFNTLRSLQNKGLMNADGTLTEVGKSVADAPPPTAAQKLQGLLDTENPADPKTGSAKKATGAEPPEKGVVKRVKQGATKWRDYLTPDEEVSLRNAEDLGDKGVAKRIRQMATDRAKGEGLGSPVQSQAGQAAAATRSEARSLGPELNPLVDQAETTRAVAGTADDVLDLQARNFPERLARDTLARQRVTEGAARGLSGPELDQLGRTMVGNKGQVVDFQRSMRPDRLPWQLENAPATPKNVANRLPTLDQARSITATQTTPRGFGGPVSPVVDMAAGGVNTTAVGPTSTALPIEARSANAQLAGNPWAQRVAQARAAGSTATVPPFAYDPLPGMEPGAVPRTATPPGATPPPMGGPIPGQGSFDDALSMARGSAMELLPTPGTAIEPTIARAAASQAMGEPIPGPRVGGFPAQELGPGPRPGALARIGVPEAGGVGAPAAARGPLALGPGPTAAGESFATNAARQATQSGTTFENIMGIGKTAAAPNVGRARQFTNFLNGLGKAAPGANMASKIGRGFVAPALPGIAATLAGNVLDNPNEVDEEGLDRADWGQGLKGAGTIASFGVPAAMAMSAGPVGWAALGVGALGFGIYSAFKGKTTPEERMSKVVTAAQSMGLPWDDTDQQKLEGKFELYKAMGMGDEEAAGAVAQEVSQAAQQYEQESANQMTPELYMALQSQYQKSLAESQAQYQNTANAAISGQMNYLSGVDPGSRPELAAMTSAAAERNAHTAWASQLAALTAPTLAMYQQEIDYTNDFAKRAQSKLMTEALSGGGTQGMSLSDLQYAQ